MLPIFKAKAAVAPNRQGENRTARVLAEVEKAWLQRRCIPVCRAIMAVLATAFAVRHHPTGLRWHLAQHDFQGKNLHFLLKNLRFSITTHAVHTRLLPIPICCHTQPAPQICPGKISDTFHIRAWHHLKRGSRLRWGLCLYIRTTFRGVLRARASGLLPAVFVNEETCTKIDQS